MIIKLLTKIILKYKNSYSDLNYIEKKIYRAHFIQRLRALDERN